ncbi:MAG: nascent polypeptide-associated complex protein [archaeon]
MIPGMNGLDPRRINAMMKQMGIENKEIEAKRVIIETDKGKIIINNPSVTEINMQGNKSFQIAGDVSEEKGNEIPEEDIIMVSESANTSRDKAKKLLIETKGDIAEAIELANKK